MADFVSTGLPRSIAAPLAGPSNPAVFELPQGVAFDLQSVFAEIDASGAGDTRATITIADSSGAVIAKKRQGEAVTGGATGTATWALRLADDGGAGTPGTAAYEAFADGAGVLCPNGATISVLPFVHTFGATLGTWDGARFNIIAAGTYALALWINCQNAGALYTVAANIRVTFGATFQAVTVTAPVPLGFPISGGGPYFGITRPLAAGDQLDVQVCHNAAAARNIALYGGLAKLA